MNIHSNFYRYCHPHPKAPVRPHYTRPLKQRHRHHHRSHKSRKQFTAGVRMHWITERYCTGDQWFSRNRIDRDPQTDRIVSWMTQYETKRKYRGEPPRFNEKLIAGNFQRSRFCLAECPMDLRREKGRKSWYRGASFFV